jgi:two-component system OmpR family response regulator
MYQDINQAPRVMIAVSDADQRRAAVAALRGAGYCVSAPTDGDAATMLAESFSPDVVVVGSELTAPSGGPLFATLRSSSEQYLICVVHEDHHLTRTDVLRMGADDAVSAPVLPDELAARCGALLRRPRALQPRNDSLVTSIVQLGPLTLDLGRRELRAGDVVILTTRIEFSLFEQLCRRPTEVCTREDLLDAVWGPKWVGDTHVVDVHLSNLRRKLDRAAPGTKVIHTVRGVGFRLANEIADDLDTTPAFGLSMVV